MELQSGWQWQLQAGSGPHGWPVGSVQVAFLGKLRGGGGDGISMEVLCVGKKVL